MVANYQHLGLVMIDIKIVYREPTVENPA